MQITIDQSFEYSPIKDYSKFKVFMVHTCIEMQNFNFSTSADVKFVYPLKVTRTNYD